MVLSGLLAVPVLAQQKELSDEEIVQLRDLLARSGKSDAKVINDLDLDFYGFARIDAAWSNSDMTTAGGGSIALWADPEPAANKNDNEFSMTARGTRLGVNIAGPGNDTVKTSGKIEFDFGLTGSENSNEPRMRHAYLVFDFPDKNFNILAGQSWDVMSPLFPPTINLGVMWDCGNLGIRRTQLRFTQVVPVNDNAAFKFEAAAARTIGQNNLDDEDTGDDSGLPSVQARVSCSMPLIAGQVSTFGVSGHYGTEEYDVAPETDSDQDFDTWSLCFDMSLPLSKQLKATGEFYTGSNYPFVYGRYRPGDNR